MFAKKSLVVWLAAAGLVVGPGALWAAEKGHSHEGHDHGAVKLSLNKGKKWPTDEALRRGMDNMRGEMSKSLHDIHEGKMDAARYESLAQKLEGEVGYVVANCKLSPDADAQLHVVLARLTEGMEAMKAGSHREEGAVKVVEALNAYGKHFNHPGWKPIKH